ncbi:MAG: hypothetical protein L6R39_007456 [Caloplaca ligustica]|nr:MAG: hypothetical protein L6R39_007456 [Caloplaca ligustica]
MQSTQNPTGQSSTSNSSASNGGVPLAGCQPPVEQSSCCHRRKAFSGEQAVKSHQLAEHNRVCLLCVSDDYFETTIEMLRYVRGKKHVDGGECDHVLPGGKPVLEKHQEGCLASHAAKTILAEEKKPSPQPPGTAVPLAELPGSAARPVPLTYSQPPAVMHPAPPHVSWDGTLYCPMCSDADGFETVDEYHFHLAKIVHPQEVGSF